MGPRSPPNLTHSTVYLTDKPYDVQLGVLRWIRGLISEVVDEAISPQLGQSTLHLTEPENSQIVSHCDDMQVEDPLALAKNEKERGAGEEEEQLSVPKGEDVHAWCDEQASSAGMLKGTAKFAADENLVSASAAPYAAVAGDSADGCRRGVGRKRERVPTQHAQDTFLPGSVVECFYPDDGWWYPASITAVIPPPPCNVMEGIPPLTETAVSNAPRKEASNEATGASDSPLLPAPSSGSALPLPLSPTSRHAASATFDVTVREDERTEGGGAHGFVVNSSPAPEAGAAIATTDIVCKGGEQNSQEGVRREKLQQPMLAVTFFGYGNKSTVPYDWVRKIVTPDLLEWCKKNDIVVESAEEVAEEVKAETRLDIGDESAAVASTCDPNEDGPASHAVVVKGIETRTPDIACYAVPPSVKGGCDEGGEHRATEGDNGSATCGRSGGNQRGKEKQQVRKRKKNKKKNKVGDGKQQVKTEEDEERFLMRCVSRSKSPYPHVPNKYWGQRYRYFSRFDEGITMDNEGWYSVTPEAIALHIAERVCCDVVVDPFVGCGGNAVQFALVSHLVFAIDIDPVKLEHARRNAAIYNVENRIEFILGDAMKVLPSLKADAVFLSPPWGGPAYQDSKTFDLHSMFPPPLSALEMFRAARKVTPNVVFFLPRNVDPAQVARLPAAAAADAAVLSADSCKPVVASTLESDRVVQERGQQLEFGNACELEKQFLNGKLKTTTAYFGEDIVTSVGTAAEKVAASGRLGQKEDGFIIPPAGSAVDPNPNASGSSGWYGEDGREGVPWSGRYVKFNEEGNSVSGCEETRTQNIGDEGGEGVSRCAETKTKNVGTSREDGSASISRKRENALYDAWMTK